jgi:hypothetical protein
MYTSGTQKYLLLFSYMFLSLLIIIWEAKNYSLHDNGLQLN